MQYDYISLILAVELSVRLTDKTADCNSGQLEILDHAGEWRKVCLDHWNQDDAAVACRQLGFHHFQNSSNGKYLFEYATYSMQSVFTSGAVSNSSSNAVAILSTNCTGDEFHLQSCDSFHLLNSNTCDSGQNVILGCVGKFSSQYVYFHAKIVAF